MTDNMRRADADIAGFQASPRLSANLQRVLVDLIENSLVRWAVVSAFFEQPGKSARASTAIISMRAIVNDPSCATSSCLSPPGPATARQ